MSAPFSSKKIALEESSLSMAWCSVVWPASFLCSKSDPASIRAESTSRFFGTALRARLSGVSASWFFKVRSSFSSLGWGAASKRARRVSNLPWATARCSAVSPTRLRPDRRSGHRSSRRRLNLGRPDRAASCSTVHPLRFRASRLLSFSSK